MGNKEITQTQEELKKIQEESQKQQLPEHKAFDRVFPYIRLPRLHPPNHGDTVIFNAPDLRANQLILGDNLEVLRTLHAESIDLIYIDPPFFSGKNYNVIWGDTNEVRSFHDIWEGGIDSYLIWLNARLWEMRRVLKKTGSIYVHCDWHASHYIKTEMDKIFGYENFRNEIVWWYYNKMQGNVKHFPKNHDSTLYYVKSDKFSFKRLSEPREKPIKQQKRVWDSNTGTLKQAKNENGKLEYYTVTEKYLDDVWKLPYLMPADQKERIGYPTQKPEALLERIIKASSNEGDVVADFFCGGGTTCAIAMKLKRWFIGCDSSRVAVAVTLDRLVKIGEDMSGVKSNVSLKDNEVFQFSLQTAITSEKVPNIEVSYLGVYPVDKFEHLSQEDFIDFVLTCYGASRNTAEGIAHGFRPPGQTEPILVGPANPNESITPEEVKAFFDEIKSRLEPNKPVRAKMIGWRFIRKIQEYVKILKDYVEENKLFAADGQTPLIDIELITLRSNRFRERVLARYPDADDADFFLRFPASPVIGDIRVKKAGELEYELEAIDAMSSEEDGWLVNCQWDFDYEVGHFAAHKEYILSREKVKDKRRGERFEAILSARHKFPKSGEYVIACKVQDNLAGETILAKTIKVDG